MSGDAANGGKENGARKLRYSVTLKLTVLVAATTAVLLAGMLLGGFFYWRNILRQEIHERLFSVATSRRDMMLAEIALLQQRAELHTDHGEFRGLLNQMLAGGPDLARNLANSQGTIDRISDGKPVWSARLANIRGRVIVASDPAEAGRELAGDPTFQQGIAGAYVSLPEQKGGRFAVAVSAPVHKKTESRDIIGVLLLSVDVTPMAKALNDTTGLGKSGELLLGMREDGQVRFLFPPRLDEKITSVPASRAPAMTAATEGRGGLFVINDYRGEPVLAAGLPVGYNGWGLVAKMDRREAYAPISDALRYALLLGSGISAVGLIAAYVLARDFTLPLRKLVNAAERIAHGDYDASVAVNSDDEFGALSADFNAMTLAIRQRSEERKRAETELRDGEQRYRSLFENNLDAMFSLDTRGRFLSANPAGIAMSGYSLEELCARTFSDLIAPEHFEKAMHAFIADLRGERQKIETVMVRKDGARRNVFVSGVPMEAGGKIVGIFGIARDVTESQRAIESLRESESLLRAVSDTTEDAVFVKDLESRMVMANPATLRIIGKPASQVIGHTDREFYDDPQIGEVILENDRRIVQSGQAEVIEETVDSPQGRRTFLSTKAPRRDAHGNIIGILGIARDITERRQSELALRESEERLRLATQIAGFGTFENDLVTGTRYWAPETKALFGLPPETEITDATIRERLHPQDRELVIRAREASFDPQGVGEFSMEHRVVWPDGTAHWLQVLSKTFFEGEGTARRAIRMIGVSQEITVRKAAEELLRNANELLEQRVQKRTAELDMAKAKLDAIIKSSPDRIAAIDPSFRFITFNEEYRLAIRDVYGVELVLGATIDDVMPPERAANTREIWSRALNGESFTIDIEREVAGKLLRFETRFHPIRDAEGRIIGASQNSRDVTDIHRVADEVRQANEELHRAKEQLETEAAERRKLDARIAETIEAERQSLRNELHDGLCQELAGIGFMTSVLSRNLAATSHPESGNARSISELVNGTLHRTRMLARGASPVEAGRDGLLFALKELAETTARAYGITCLFEGGASVPFASNAAAAHLYRIAQEATHNAVGHGKAKLIRISLTPDAAGGRLSILNDGAGFVEPAHGHSGMGVRLMRHRAAAIGATLTIGPLGEGGGTAVVCEWTEAL